VLSTSLGSEHRQDTSSTSNLSNKANRQHSSQLRLELEAEKTESPAFSSSRARRGWAHVEDDLVLEEVRVLLDSVSVREGSDGVLEHLLVNT
jgi:hypothetical protein